MELHGVISGQGNNQAFLMELQQRVLGIFQEQAVVTERWHGNGDLSQEVQILEHRTLEQEPGRQDYLSNRWTNICNTNKLCFQKLHFGSETTDQPSLGWARVRCYQLSWRKPADGWWHRPPRSEAWTRMCSCLFAWKKDVLLYGKAIPVMQQDRNNV